MLHQWLGEICHDLDFGQQLDRDSLSGDRAARSVMGMHSSVKDFQNAAQTDKFDLNRLPRGFSRPWGFFGPRPDLGATPESPRATHS